MAESSGRVPIIACVRDAWLFLINNWRLFLPAAAIVAVISEIGPTITLLTSSGDVSGATQSTPSLLVTVIPMVLGGIMFSAAVLRKAVRDEYKPPVGLTLGADEGRLFAANLCVLLVAIPIVLLLAVFLIATVLQPVAPTREAMEALAADPDALFEAVTQALGPFGSLVLFALVIVLTALALGLVALANAATIGERKIVVFQAWQWISGNFLRVLCAMVLIVLPVMVVSTIISQVLLSMLLSMSGETVDVTAYLLVAVVITFLNLLVAAPITALGAVLYKGLRPAGFVAK
jgi:hypothetical protein